MEHNNISLEQKSTDQSDNIVNFEGCLTMPL